MTVNPKTYIEHVNYLHEIVKLKLFFLWNWLKRNPNEDFASALRQRVDIYRKTDINDGFANHKKRRFDDPRWLKIELALKELYRTCKKECNSIRFELESFEILRPHIDARAPRDFAEPLEAIAFNYRCGSLDYDPPTSSQPKRVFLHVANAIAPRSIFDEKSYLADCFLDLIRRCRQDYQADSLDTLTWLNSYPRWLTYFPKTWLDNTSAPNKDVSCGFDFWGQFLTARGTFNAKYGEIMRQTGEFPHWPRHSWCFFDDLERHLKENIYSKH